MDETANPSLQGSNLSVADLSVEDKVRVVGGRDAWTTNEIVVDGQLAVASIKVTDGPIGARGNSETGARAVCLPAPIAMAATFDVELVHALGQLLGTETRRKQSQVLLAPTLNLARHPLGGRNFESFGEEPNLVAAMAVAYIGGVQESGVMACAKHLVANDAEWARLYVDTVVDEQTLREVYLMPFEAAVAAGVGTVMSAYPRLNGTHCSENAWLLTDVLRGEWSFEGVVVSDWGAAHDGVASLRAGLDLEMPGPVQAFGSALLDAVDEGRLASDELDIAVERLARLAEATGAAGVDQSDEQTVDLPEERVIARRAATEAMVLVKNTGILPLEASNLDSGTDSSNGIAVIGPNAEPGFEQGGGSALVPAHYQSSPVAGITNAVPGDVPVTYEIGCVTPRFLPPVDPALWQGPIRLEKFADPDPDGPFPDGPVASTTTVSTIGAFVHGYDPDLGETFDWCYRWTTQLSVNETGSHKLGLHAVGPARLLVGGQLLVDNWTDPTPGHGFFQKASRELVETVDLVAGEPVDVVVEWRRGDDLSLAGLALGHQRPVDEAAMMANAVDAASRASVVVVVVGLDDQWETESHDRLSFGLPDAQNKLVSAVAAVNENTVVVLNAGSPVDMPWFDEVAAVIVAWYPGQEFGSALAEVLFGQAEPGGRMPVTFPTSMSTCPTATSVPHADVRPELPGTGIDDPRMEYLERVHIGHRWYHREGQQARLAFGFGLGYTTFELGEPTVSPERAVVDTPAASTQSGLDPDAGPVTISVPVTNTGGRAGKCVVQVYSRPTPETEAMLPLTDQPRPRVLAGASVVRLEPGGSGTAVVKVPARVFCRWAGDDTGGGQWSVIEGLNDLEISLSSVDTAHRAQVEISAGK